MYRHPLGGNCTGIHRWYSLSDKSNLGSGWKEYKKSGTVHGIQMPSGLQESQKLEKPLFTPSTKAEQGEHDENIHPDKCISFLLFLQ
jgi:phosphoribosylaminoimidazole-succinocarboxamide synthase